jgi:hypothetical protein
MIPAAALAEGSREDDSLPARADSSAAFLLAEVTAEDISGTGRLESSRAGPSAGVYQAMEPPGPSRGSARMPAATAESSRLRTPVARDQDALADGSASWDGSEA